MIFEEQINRKPDHYPWTDQFIKAIHNGFWTDQQFNFSSDVQDFKVILTSRDREVVTRTLSAIGQVEVQVKKFWAKLGDNLPHPSLCDLGYVMANTEVIHGNAYERIFKVLGIEKVFEDFLKEDCLKNRVNYLRKYNHKFYKDSKKQYVYALILFTLFVENVSLFSQFYVINWYYKNKNVLKDTNQQIKYTRQEEQLHAMVGIKLINTIREEHPELFDAELEERVIHEAHQAIIAEGRISDWILEDLNSKEEDSYAKKGLSSEILKEFIKARTNDSMRQIGFKAPFEIDEKLIAETAWFDETLHGNTETDFFHARPVEYSEHDRSIDDSDLFND